MIQTFPTKLPLVVLTTFLLIAFSSSRSTAATSVSQFGITWTFDGDYRTGQFANGDYWVLGPVTITSISPSDPDPSDNTDFHGMVINPIPDTVSPFVQAWDSRIGEGTTYDRALNVARQLPLWVPPGSSVVSTRSYSQRNKLWIQDAAVLTVVQTEVPQGSFRPAYAGTDKRIPGTIADLNLSALRNLSPVPGTPKLNSFDGAFTQPLLDILGQWQNSSIKNANAGPNYGRDIAKQVGDAVLSLNLDYPPEQKLPLLIKIVQRGIDTHGLAKAGMVWYPNGGHNTGRKLPLLVAAVVLGNSEMLEWADAQKHFIFQEDMQHWYIAPDDVSLPRKEATLVPYATDAVGVAEWASNPVTERHQTGAQWGKPYRIVNGVVNTGLVLAAEIMGLRDEWNWEPLFDYIEKRFWPIEGVKPTSPQQIPKFHRNMWEAYRESAAADAKL